MLTPDDLRDNSQSGYRYVSYNRPDRPTDSSHGGGKSLYQGQRAGPGSPAYFRGPMRATAHAAAQDVCDQVNTGKVPTPKRLNSAGHKRPQQRKQPDPPEVIAARRVVREHDAARRAGSKGYVYLVAEAPKPPFEAVKIGWSMSPATRVAGLQTGNPRKLYVLASKTGTEADEAALHAKYIKQNVLQEWFRPTAQLLSEFGLSPDQKEASAT